MGGTMRLGLYPADLHAGLGRGRGVRRHPGRGATPAPLRGQQQVPRRPRGGRAWCSPGCSPDRELVEFVELPARRPPLLRGHPGPPRAALATDPAAPALQRPDRGRDRRGSASCGCRSTRAGCGGACPSRCLSTPLSTTDGARRGRGRAGRSADATSTSPGRSSQSDTRSRAGSCRRNRYGPRPGRRGVRPRGRPAPGAVAVVARRRGGSRPGAHPVPAPRAAAARRAPGRAARRGGGGAARGRPA